MSTLFFSYSHEDEGLRDRLDKHLTMLKRQGAISAWHDRRIVAGDPLDKRIDEHLEQDDIILLLVSADFLASEYCYGVEVRRAMERHASGSARVIPVILKPCDWKSAPFGTLLAAPKDGKPITTWTNEDEAFLDVVRQIREALPVKVATRSEISGPPVPKPTDTPVAAPVIRSSNLRLRKQFSDADRDRFLDKAFEYMARFFKNSLNELGARKPGVEGRFRQLDGTRFTAVIYEAGATRTQCAITLGGFFGRGISYSNAVGGMGNSYNEMLSVEHDEQHLYLKPMGMAMMGGARDAQLSFAGAAEYFWSMLIEPLQLRAGRSIFMSSVTIGGEQRPMGEASPSWITEQIERRRRDGAAVCVVVCVKATGLDMRLATPGCSGGGGGGRPPNANEKAIFDLWQKHRLNESGFAPGDVVAFLAQLRHLL